MRPIIRAVAAGALLTSAGILAGCSGSSTSGTRRSQDGPPKLSAADAWEEVLKDCAGNQTLSFKNMVYLGPSNNTGVGTIWRRMEGGGYQLMRLPPTLPRGAVNVPETWSTCSGTNPKRFSVNASADVVLARIKGVSAGLAADLNRAKRVELRVNAWRQVQLVGDGFSDWVNGLPERDPYKRSLLKQDRVVAYRAEVKGMTATLTFDEEVAGDLHGKFAPGEKEKGSIAEAGAKLKAEFKGSNTLQITAPEAFVIEAEFDKYSPSSGDFRGGLTPVSSKNCAGASGPALPC